jgi:hypothetical protein
MAFKIKDLMITDLSAASQVKGCNAKHTLCAVFEFSCIDASRAFNYGCKFPNSAVGLAIEPAQQLAPQICYYCSHLTCGCTYGCTVSHPLQPIAPAESGQLAVAALSALKEQLKQQLAEVEKQQAAAEADLQPQTVEDVDTLTKKLKDALDELKARRAELSGKPE